MSDKNISPKVQRVLDLIQTHENSKTELINYFNNINNDPSISDYEREVLVKAVETEMRTKFP